MGRVYKTIARVVEKGHRTGFIVLTTDKNDRKVHLELTNSQIKRMLDNGEHFDIHINGRGFEFNDKEKRISDLPIKYKYKKPSHDETSGIYGYTGNELLNYIRNSGTSVYKKRDFVYGILKYCSSNENRVLSISGLRGTGKTTGLIQAMEEIGKYEKIVYLNIDTSADIDCRILRDYILNKYGDKEYIFIDEITVVKDLINKSRFLHDILTMSGKKVIICGTDSLALVKSKGDGLYHRVINLNVTHITFAEAQRTMNQSLKDYVRIGGLYKEDTIRNVEDLITYVDTAVVDNIMNTLTKNRDTTSLLGLSKIGVDAIRTVVFRVIYAIIYSNVTKNKKTSIKQIINMFDYSESDIYDRESLSDLVLGSMRVGDKVDITEDGIRAILSAMEQIGLVVKLRNLFDTSECSYYITNPSIVKQLIREMILILDGTGLSRRHGYNAKSMEGHVFESVIVCHTKKAADKLGYNLYYYRDDNGKEIDLIVEKEMQGLFEDLYLYYEIKMTSDYDTAVVKSVWINDSEIGSLGMVIGKGIIYAGKDDKFNGFRSADVYPSKGMTIEQIENKNMGIKLISAYEYLLNTISKLKILDEYGQEYM